MIYVLDACTFINLANSGQFATVIGLPGRQFRISGAVRGESITVATALDAAISAGFLQEIDDNKLPVSGFTNLKNRFELGDGETECLQAAQIFGCSIACDDAAARKAAITLIGRDRVTGSIGLLKQCVLAGLLTPETAYEAYRQMKEQGGFLPHQSLHDFQTH